MDELTEHLKETARAMGQALVEQLPAATCRCCPAPMSKIDPTRCQNCDYETNWTEAMIAEYRATL